MPVHFRIEDFDVGSTFWGKKFYVRDRTSGRTFYPSRAALDQFNRLIEEAQKRNLSKNTNHFVVQYIAHRLVGAAVYPHELATTMFLSAVPARLVNSAIEAYGGSTLFDFVSADLHKPGQWHVVFDDNDVRLEYDAGTEDLRVTKMQTAEQVTATQSQARQYRSVIAEARKRSPDEAAQQQALGLVQRTFCRAMILGPSSKLYQVFFAQEPSTVATVIAAASR